MTEQIKKLFNVFAYGIIIAAISIGSMYVYDTWLRKEPPIMKVPAITKENIKKAIPDMTEHDVSDAEHQINRAKNTEAPKRHWVSADERTSDEKAQKQAKADKADKVIKETKEQKIEGTDESFVEANYYAINLNRKHEVKMGAAVIDGTPYASLGYRNRDTEYTAYYGSNGNIGAGVAVTIAKW